MTKYEELLKLYDCCQITDNQAKTEAETIAEKAEENNNAETLKTIFSCIDLTSLNNSDTNEKIGKWAKKAVRFSEKYPEMPNVAALCVYPACVATAKEALGDNSAIELASVAAGFPAPQTFMEVKIAETALAVQDGATEIDMVFPLNYFLEGDYEKVEEEIVEVKSTCRNAKLKVILETSCLKSAEKIAQAAVLAMACGADFIKTSTGKSGDGATPEGAYVMAKAVKEFNTRNNVKIGLKLAGGIAEASDAVKLYTIVSEVLGKNYMKKDTFRIGASRLANNLLSAISGKKEKYF